MLLVTYLVNTKRCIKTQKITETLANGYSSESTQRELSNEYQDDRVSSFSQESCILVLWMKVVSALEWLSLQAPAPCFITLPSPVFKNSFRKDYQSQLHCIIKLARRQFWPCWTTYHKAVLVLVSHLLLALLEGCLLCLLLAGVGSTWPSTLLDFHRGTGPVIYNTHRKQYTQC